MTGLVVDLFAGGGGASEGIRMALGWPGEPRAPWPPDLPKGSRVRVRLVARDQDVAQAAAEDPDDAVLAELAEPCARFEMSFTTSEPFQDAGGAWWVKVLGRREAVRCGDCEVAR